MDSNHSSASSLLQGDVHHDGNLSLVNDHSHQSVPGGNELVDMLLISDEGQSDQSVSPHLNHFHSHLLDDQEVRDRLLRDIQEEAQRDPDSINADSHSDLSSEHEHSLHYSIPSEDSSVSHSPVDISDQIISQKRENGHTHHDEVNQNEKSPNNSSNSIYGLTQQQILQQQQLMALQYLMLQQFSAQQSTTSSNGTTSQPGLFMPHAFPVLDTNTGNILLLPIPFAPSTGVSGSHSTSSPNDGTTSTSTTVPAVMIPTVFHDPRPAAYRNNLPSTPRRRRTRKPKVTPPPETEQQDLQPIRKTAPSDLRCYELRIGSYQLLSHKNGGLTGVEMNVKFYYGKKAIGYEIVGIDAPNGPQIPAAPGVSIKYKMEYRFTSIIGISFEDTTMVIPSLSNTTPNEFVQMTIDLSEPPVFTEKIKTPEVITPAWRHRSDFTENQQASQIRRHILVFEKKQLEKAKATLLSTNLELNHLACSNSITQTLNDSDLGFPPKHIPLIEDLSPNSSMGPGPKRKKTKVAAEDSCKCTSGCVNNRCVCLKNSRGCPNAQCRCRACRNPFNIVERVLGSTNVEPNEDICLRDNILRIKDMESTLQQNIQGTCDCGTFIIKAYQCIPRYTCSHCSHTFTYSWCHNQICNELGPYVHCKECKTCVTMKEIHCSSCNKCFTADHPSSSCPRCTVDVHSESHNDHLDLNSNDDHDLHHYDEDDHSLGDGSGFIDVSL